VETKLIELYLLICRLYDTHPVLKQQRLSNNHKPLFSDEELLTMYLSGASARSNDATPDL
jgi:hypothetical protein